MTTRYKPAPNYDFYSKRRVFGMISALLVLATIALMIVPGLNYGIDFAGGSNIAVSFNDEMTDEEIRQAMVTIGIQDASVVKFGGEGQNDFVIQTRSVSAITQEQRNIANAAVVEAFGEGAQIIFDESSPDRLTARLPQSAYGVSDSDDNVEASVYADQAETLVARLDEVLQAAGLDGANSEPWGNPADRRFVVRVAGMQSMIADALTAEFGSKFVEITRIETVGPRVGEQLRDDAMKAVIVSMLLILLYVAVRFELRYAPGAVIALIFDVMMVIGVFAVFRIEFDITTIASLLTIVGYSLNDKIVNFDRIRENIQDGALERGETLEQVVNRSINECLSRTFMTGATTIAALVAIIVLGGPETRSFAIALFLGVVVGIFSSLYISNSVMIWMSHELDKRMPPSGTTPKRNRDELVV